MKSKLLLLASSILVISGCQPDDPQPQSINGRVIDGYIKGAKVTLDLNFNGEADLNEPYAYTTVGGQYELIINELDQSCLDYAPLIVEVPVGAIDEDLGDIKTAFTMTYPPAFLIDSAPDVRYVTPFSTLIWQLIQNEADTQGLELSCENLRENTELVKKVQGIVTRALYGITWHYNVAPESVFSDFISSEDTEAQESAQAIVRGWQKSALATQELQKENPDAFYVSVNYYRFDSRDHGDAYPHAWYRETTIRSENIENSLVEKVDDDLDNTLRVIMKGEQSYIRDRDDFDISYFEEYESRNGDDSPYYCEFVEIIKFNDNEYSFEINNRVNFDQEINDPSGCKVDSYKEMVNERYVFINSPSNETVQFYFKRPDGGFSLLDDFIEPTVKTGVEVSQLVTSLKTLPYQYSSDGISDADWAQKTKTEYDEESRTDTRKNINSEGNISYRRQTYFNNGTHSPEQCQSDEGEWIDCK